jgi:hypothetical protein
MFSVWMQYFQSKKKLILLYSLDWLVGGVFLICGCLLEWMVPFQRIIASNQSLEFPYQPFDTVPSYYLPIIGFFLPEFIIFIYLFFIKKRSWEQIHLTILGLFLAGSFTYVLTNVIKVSWDKTSNHATVFPFSLGSEDLDPIF